LKSNVFKVTFKYIPKRTGNWKKEEETMKRTLILMTALNLVAMIAGVGTALAFDLNMIVPMPEPTSMILVAAGLLGVAGISIRRKK